MTGWHNQNSSLKKFFSFFLLLKQDSVLVTFLTFFSLIWGKWSSYFPCVFMATVTLVTNFSLKFLHEGLVTIETIQSNSQKYILGHLSWKPCHYYLQVHMVEADKHDSPMKNKQNMVFANLKEIQHFHET